MVGPEPEPEWQLADWPTSGKTRGKDPLVRP